MTMRRSEVRVRRDYEKLTITAYIKPATASVGLTQWIKDGTPSPDHSVTPLVLTVDCQANASDITPEQIFSVGAEGGTAGDGNTAWTVNGTAISEVWTEGTDYELQESGKELWIKRNIKSTETYAIACQLQVYDSRTGETIPFITDTVELSTVELANSPYRISIDHSNVIWDMTADDLWEYEYRAARSLTQKMTRAEAENDACYKKTVNVCVTQGKQIEAGYGLVLKTSDGTEAARIEATDDEATLTEDKAILELTRGKIVFDCRLIEDEAFTLTVLNSEGKEIKSCATQIHVKRRMRDYDQPEIVNYSDYTVKQQTYRNTLRVRIGGEEVDYPECYLYILWLTLAMTASAEEAEVGAGDTCKFDPNKAGAGLTDADNGFHMIADTDYQPILQAATDGTDYLTDGEGNTLII